MLLRDKHIHCILFDIYTYLCTVFCSFISEEWQEGCYVMDQRHDQQDFVQVLSLWKQLVHRIRATPPSLVSRFWSLWPWDLQKLQGLGRGSRDQKAFLLDSLCLLASIFPVAPRPQCHSILHIPVLPVNRKQKFLREIMSWWSIYVWGIVTIKSAWQMAITMTPWLPATWSPGMPR